MNMKTVYMILVAGIFLFANISAAYAQAGKVYEDMSRAERLVFVGEQARRIAREMSGSEYDFTPEFERDIQRAVTQYAQRIGGTEVDGKKKTDLRVVLARGQDNAPIINGAFRARNVSPLIGLYLAWIESEYQNIESAKPSGAVGMFQFLPETGANYGLSVPELLDVAKSADAAARYILNSVNSFKNDPMKEALALVAYNRGVQKTSRDLKVLLNEQNKRCSVCALSSDRSKLDERYQYENTLYVPRFFAAAIIGENPQAFGIQSRPLSSN
jgi:hypothetical protein